MEEQSKELVIGWFDDERAAERVLAKMLAAQGAEGLGLQETAVVTREADGSLRIKETGEVGAARGAVAGGLVGGLLGMLTGRTAAGAGLGALLGAAGAAAFDTGIPDERLEGIGEVMGAGTSTVVVVVDSSGAEAVRQLLGDAGAKVVSEAYAEAVARLTIPDTGNEEIDALKAKAAASLGGAAASAERAVASASDKAEAAAREVLGKTKPATGDAPEGAGKDTEAPA